MRHRLGLALAAALLTSCALVAGIERFEAGPGSSALSTLADGAPLPDADSDGGMPTCVAPCDEVNCPGGTCFARLLAGLERPTSIARIDDTIVVASDGLVDGGGTLTVVPRAGGTVRILGIDLARPIVRQGAVDGGDVVAYERGAATEKLKFSAFLQDGGLEALSEGTDIESAAASKTWTARALVNERELRIDQRGEKRSKRENEARVFGLMGDLLVTLSRENQVVVSEVSLQTNSDPDFGTSTSVETKKLGEVSLGPIAEALLDRDRVYLATTDASIEAVHYDTSDAGRYGTIPGDIVALAADPSFLYVGSTEGIFALEKTTRVVTKRYAIVVGGLAVDERFLYWTDPVGGTVVRAPK